MKVDQMSVCERSSLTDKLNKISPQFWGALYFGVSTFNLTVYVYFHHCLGTLFQVEGSCFQCKHFGRLHTKCPTPWATYPHIYCRRLRSSQRRWKSNQCLISIDQKARWSVSTGLENKQLLAIKFPISKLYGHNVCVDLRVLSSAATSGKKKPKKKNT